jgi:hypothetical protein
VSRSDLNAKDQLLAASLARGSSQAQAAREAGLADRTVRRRLADPDFVQLVVDARDEHVMRTTDRLASLTDKAVDTLDELVTAEDVPANVRLRAALGILNAHRVARETSELENRLQAMELQMRGVDRSAGGGGT